MKRQTQVPEVVKAQTRKQDGLTEPERLKRQVEGAGKCAGWNGALFSTNNEGNRWCVMAAVPSARTLGAPSAAPRCWWWGGGPCVCVG